MTDILFERRGAAGLVTLNRPDALNAVTHAMVRALAEQLRAWETDPAVTRVVVTAAGGRAFSAGGDLRALYDLGRAGRFDEALGFWRDEYRLNAIIKRYRKPYVSIIDGVMMGGGVGICDPRLASGRRRWFPLRDAGSRDRVFPGHRRDLVPAAAGGRGGHLLRAYRRAGRSRRRDGAWHRHPSRAVGAVAGFAGRTVLGGAGRCAVGRLCGAGQATARSSCTVRPSIGCSRLAGSRTSCPSLDTAGLAGDPDGAFARRAAATIRTKSPTSLKIALAQLRRGKTLDFEACLRTEFRIVSRVVTGHDFYEGIRAVIVDKDHSPAWRPPTLDAVSDADVAGYFAPVARELDLS